MARLKYQLRAVGLDFLGTAPVKLVFSAAVAAPPGTVYHALAEDTPGWSEWFAAVKYARPTEAGRHVVLSGGLRFEETVLIAEEPGRYVYRADATNRPGVRAMLEEWRVEPAAGCSLVQWTIAVDPAPATAGFLRLLTPVLRSSFRTAMQKLDRRNL
ncbi:SRPBCC family protein [Streptomyces sp.]|uniref:SRPBCC family protein n=1 Tax=Streptomyces sp. TaxID=1931 RepID=UPI002F417136